MGVERTPPPGDKTIGESQPIQGQVFIPTNPMPINTIPLASTIDNILNSVSSVATTSVTTTFSTSIANSASVYTVCSTMSTSSVSASPISSIIKPTIKTAKRDRRSPLKQARKEKRQKTIDTYWLKSQSNRFQALSSSSDDEEEIVNEPSVVNKNNKGPNSIQVEKNNASTPKPPPIYIQKVEEISPLKSELNKIAPNKFDLKILSNGEVKVQLHSPTHYIETIKMLKLKSTEYYTYKPKNERGFKIILRNMHYSTDMDEIKQELLLQNHKVINIYNILQRGSRNPTSLFSIELETSPNNKEVYSIQYLLNCKISFEPPHHKRTIPQCSNCQKYGHTKNFCNLNPVCVKCAGKHKTADCKKLSNDNSTQCALCSGNHTANYKGCEVYKTLKIQRFPKVQNKQLDTNTANSDPKTKPSNVQDHNLLPNSKIQSQESYASVTSKNTNPPTQSVNNDFSELKQMMKEMMSQISSMLNVILTLIQKLDAK